jgi:outer membrane protein TolC
MSVMKIPRLCRALVPIAGACIAIAAAQAAGAQTAAAQTAAARVDSLDLSLDAALERALESSEEVMLARSQVDLAAARVRDAWSAALPQISGSAGYTRTVKSAFDTGGGDFELPDSLKFEPDPTASIEDRIAYLEDKTPNAAFGALAQLFGDLPFGQKNAYTFGLSGSQLLYSGGRTGAGLRIASSVADAARLNLQEQTAAIELDVRTAYYRALFARELVGISSDALERARRFLDEERLRFEAGRASDLDVMRAQVELENLRPQLIEARNAVDLAELNLKRLVNVPLEQPLRMTTRLESPPIQGRVDVRLDPEVLGAQRASVQALREQVRIREQQVRIARSGYLPIVSFNTSYGRLIYPSTLFAFGEQWRTDFTLSLNVQIPIFDGFRRTAQVQGARVELHQAQLQVRQLEEAIQLEYEQALGEKQRALAQIDARETTVDQAQRVYELTEMRYEQGLATQLDVFSALLSLNQARVNLARALTDYYVADAGVDRAMGGNLQ